MAMSTVMLPGPQPTSRTCMSGLRTSRMYAAELATVRQACDALRWFLTHGGNLDIKEGDGMTAHAMIDIARARGNAGVVRVRKQLCAIAEEEDQRRARLAGQVCTCCGRGEREGVSLKLCSGCRVARYCSSGLSCQKVDWPRHKISCKKARVQ